MHLKMHGAQINVYTVWHHNDDERRPYETTHGTQNLIEVPYIYFIFLLDCFTLRYERIYTNFQQTYQNRHFAAPVHTHTVVLIRFAKLEFVEL